MENTRVFQKVPGLALLKKKSPSPFEIVTLRSNAPVTVFLPLLECSLEVILCQRVHDLLRLVLDLGNGVKTAAFQLHLHLREKEDVGRS
jgi:hypothetical protein